MARNTEQLLDYCRTDIEMAFDPYTNENISSGCAIRTPPKSTCPLPPWAFSQSRTVRAVNRMESVNKSLLLYICSGMISPGFDRLGVQIWFEFYRGYNRRLNKKTLPKCQKLVAFALLRYSESVMRKPKTLQHKEIWESLGCTRATFYSDWMPRLRLMTGVIERLENAAINEYLAARSEDAERRVGER